MLRHIPRTFHVSSLFFVTNLYQGTLWWTLLCLPNCHVLTTLPQWTLICSAASSFPFPQGQHDYLSKLVLSIFLASVNLSGRGLVTIAQADLKNKCHSGGADPLIHRVRREWHTDPTATGGHLMVSRNPHLS